MIPHHIYQTASAFDALLMLEIKQKYHAQKVY